MEPEMENVIPPRPAFLTEKRELIFGLLTLIFGILTVNSVFFAGFYLGFAIFASLTLILGAAYLLSRGGNLTVYSASLLLLSLVIVASFARGDDGFIKFVLFCFLLVAANLGLCLMAGKNRHAPKGLTSLLDVFRTVTVRTFGSMPKAFRGLARCFKSSGSAGKAGGAVAIGLLVALPVVAILIPLLVSADAAFDGLLKLLPEVKLGEIVASVLCGGALALYLYIRGTALAHSDNTPAQPRTRKGIHALTVHTVLCAVSVVYVAYLISQLAYFAGGFSGILPEEFTMAEYARRGFFEMAWICAINLAVIALAVGLVRKKEGKTPLLTKLLCLFVGIVTLFLVVSASAKMFMYIDSFGLTRLRVLTEVIMVFMALVTVFIGLWIFFPKLPYMKAVLVTALIMGAAVAWADVDTQVAKYNVAAYQSGKLETVDVEHLGSLGTGAIPYITQLTGDKDPYVAVKALEALHSRELYDDFRGWNYSQQLADDYIINEHEPPAGLESFNWSYTLPNGYAIWNMDDRQLLCVKTAPDGSSFTPVLDKYVVAFQHDGRYVGLKCVDVPEDENAPVDRHDKVTCYLLNTATGHLTVPMTEKTFDRVYNWADYYKDYLDDQWVYTNSDPDYNGW